MGFFYDPTTNTYPSLVLRYDGASWQIVPTPARGNDYLTDVTCIAVDDCWAVGYSYTGVAGGYHVTLIMRWDGTTWPIADSPNPLGNEATLAPPQLYGVTCTGASDCWAAGSTFVGTLVSGVNQNLLLHVDGAEWSLAEAPNARYDEVSPQHNLLRDISCRAPDDCRAWGSYYHAPFPLLDFCVAFSGIGVCNTLRVLDLMLHYDGQRWAVVTSQEEDGGGTRFLQGGSCEHISGCLAVGERRDPDQTAKKQTLIAQHSGDSWSLVASPGDESQSSRLYDVACAADVTDGSDCWAVGRNGKETLILRSRDGG